MALDAPPTVRLYGHPGLLRVLAPGAAPSMAAPVPQRTDVRTDHGPNGQGPTEPGPRHPTADGGPGGPVPPGEGHPSVGRASFDGHPAPPVAAVGRDDGERWLWEGAVDGPGLAAILRAAMLHGMVPCDVGGRPHRARAVGCWYDAAGGTAVVELAGPPEPLA